MKVFGFDFVAYPERLDHLKVGADLPWPLSKEHFRPDAAVSTYREHLDGWELMDELGFDGIGFNEHHTSPYGLMTSPNVMAAAATQRTSRMKLLIMGNVLPIHDPLRVAEELAMLDCMSDGRIISGFVRGIPREYSVYNVDLRESRDRFEEAWEIIKKAWTEDVFSYEGKYWSYNEVAIWPRPVQEPHPPVWVPVSGSQETIEWAGRENAPIIPGNFAPRSVKQNIVRYYAECLAKHGHTITPDHLSIGASPYVADNREQALKEAGPYALYFFHTLLSHGNVANMARQRERGYLKEASHDYMTPENRESLGNFQRFTEYTLDDIERTDRACFGSPEEVRDYLINLADSMGTNTLLLNFNQGALPHDLYIQNLERFGKEVLPGLQAHEVNAVPVG